jgi:uncharacterized protein
MKELLYQINPWWENLELKKSIKRNRYTNKLIDLIQKKEIIILTGLRRVGKTTLMKQIISHLLKTKKKEKILYVSLDILALKDLSIGEIIREYRKMHSISSNDNVFIFLDEITYKKNYNQELKNLYDIGSCKIFASSSSASLLREDSGFLTGRVRYIEIEPLNFIEFMDFNNFKPKKSDYHLIENQFQEYMKYGGMPEYVLTKDPTYINELINNIVLKDVVAKNKLRNSSLIFDLLKLLMERSGKQISYNKISKILDISHETAQVYVKYFLDTFLFSIIEKEGKLNERIKGNKKIYCSDVGIRNVIIGKKDLGSIFENLVFLKIKHKNPRFLYKDGIEIDFITKDELIEVKLGQELNEKQKKLFNSIKKKKIIVKDFDFFIDDLN